MLAAGDRWGRYVIEGVLGEGGMGVVYKALDSRLNRRVALKVVRAVEPAPSVGRTDAKARLLAEARATAALHHPNVALVYDVGEHEGAPFIAMELVAGRTLRAFIGDPSVPPARRIRWLVDAARALAAAHKAGLVHRDVKPENVMVRDDGAVKVLDFGIARRTAAPASGEGEGGAGAHSAGGDNVTTLTAGNAMVGTPLYLAPEQIRGDGATARTDQFTWGVLAYELFAGRVPWRRRDDRMALLACILTEEPEPPHAPGAPSEVTAVILRALQKDPSQRFASMDDIVAILDPFGHESSFAGATARASASPPSVSPSRHGERAGAPRRRGGALVIGAAALALALAAGGIALKRGLTGDPAIPSPSASAPPAPPQEAQPTSSNPAALAAYQAAMQALRDGNLAAHESGLREAVRLDPAFPKAELRLAQAMLLSSRWTIADARQHLQKAARLRSLMPERDQMHLAALEAAISRDPPDIVEHERQMRAIGERFPDDVDLLAPLGMAQVMIGRIDEAMKTFDRVLALDPKFMQVWQMKAQLQRRKGDIEGARRTLTLCMERLPATTSCRWERLSLNEVDGRCDDVEEDARQIIAADSSSYRAYVVLAGAAAALGRPRDASVELLKQAWARAPAEARAREELLAAANLALLGGDFEGARDLAKRYAAENASSPTVEVHAQGARLLVSIALEIGDVQGAGRIAREFLNKQPAWSAFLRPMNDVTPLMMHVERRAGLRSAAELSAGRADWADTWKERLKPRDDAGARAQVWFAGFAAPALTREDAEEALAARSSYGPLPPALVASADPRYDEAVGRTLLLAGKAEEAAGALGRAARMCAALDYPVVQARARLLLGQALEEKGNKEGACAAYGKVIRWWGNARLRSVTGEKARERSKALGCGTG